MIGTNELNHSEEDNIKDSLAIFGLTSINPNIIINKISIVSQLILCQYYINMKKRKHYFKEKSLISSVFFLFTLIPSPTLL